MTVKRIKENVNPEELTLDSANANKGTERGVYVMDQSFADAGPGRSILIDAGGNVIAGNKALEAAIRAGIPLDVIQTHGEALLVHQRMDLDLSDPTGPARRMAYYDNRASEVGLDWDLEQMQKDADAGLDLMEFFFPSELKEFGIDIDTSVDFEGTSPRSMAAASDDLEPHNQTRVEEGQRYQCGSHLLIVGHQAKVGDAEVMIRAWEKYTGSHAVLLDVEDAFDLE